jgi:RpiR family carbohydrate utilization transcriptional regulator
MDTIDVLTEVRRRLPHLSRGQSRIARFVLDRPDRAKEISLKDLCGKCDTSEPVVFAFCDALGFDGFRSFKTALAVDLGSRAGLAGEAEVQDEELHEIDDPALFLKTLAGHYLRSIRETVASLVPDRFQAAVGLLERAKRIVLLGVGVSGNVGFVALQNFLRTGTPVTWTNDPNLNFTHLAPLEKGDVCIALSQTGSQKDTIEGAAFAKRRGITVIAITSDPEGPLADLADILLLTAPVATPANTHFSIGAQLATPVLLVTDALAVALGARRKKGMEERSRATAEAMKARTARSRRRLSGFS